MGSEYSNTKSRNYTRHFRAYAKLGLILGFLSVILCFNLSAQENQSINRQIFLNSNVDRFVKEQYYITKRFALNEEAFKSSTWKLFYRDTDAAIDIDSIIFVEDKTFLLFKIPELVFYDNMRVSLRNYLLSEDKIEESTRGNALSKVVENKRITCSSPMSAIATVDWTGGFCNICSSSSPSYACSSFGTWAMGIQNFTDPLPPGAFVESISVEVFGVGGCSGANTTTVIVAGSTLGTGALPGGCSCNTCFSLTESSMYASCTEPSGYVYGGVNTIQLIASGGVICVDYADITITYCMDATPVITCPSSASFECDGMGNVSDIETWLNSVSASDPGGSIIAITNNYDASNFMGCSNTGSQIVTFIAEDDCGSFDTCMATITITDTTDPIAPSAPVDFVGQCAGDVPAAITLTAVDNCDGNITVSPVDDLTPGSCVNDFTIVRKWIFTDACGNESNVSQNITISDTTDPVAPSAPVDFVGQCAGDVPASINLTAIDNCDGNITVSPVDDLTPGSCVNDFTIVRKWIFTDGCGNESSISQNITISDTTDPVAPSAPVDFVGQCAGDVPASINLTAIDNCDGNITVSPVDDLTPGSCVNDFTIVRKWIFTDACGNESSVSQNITISDTTDPVAPVAPVDFVGQCAGDVPASINLTAIDNCDGNITVSPVDDLTPGSCVNDFMIVRTWIFTDGCGNESSISQNITISDTTDPVAPSAPVDFVGQCAGDVPASITLTAIDNCDGNITVSPVDDLTPGSCVNNFMIVRTWTFTDLCGNESSVSQTITVSDDTAPVAPSAPADVMEQCATDVPAEVDLTATDNCDGNITVSPTADTTAGACINDFMIVRTWTFTDLCGNESSVSQTITVSDDTAPVAPSAPADIMEQCATDVPSEVDLTATDNCDGNITVSPTADTTAGACINDFMIVRTWTFTDLCGNESSVSQTIIISDDTAPIAPSTPADVTEQCATDVPAEVDLTATDNCDGNITVSPTADTTAGACINDFMIVRTWTFTDLCGNESSVSQTITVSDDTAPVAPIAPTDVTEQCATDVPSEVDLTATDNCDGDITVSPTADTTAGACINDFMIVRTWTFTDLCGNESSVSQTIKVSDDIAPVAPSAPADVTEQCATDVPAEVNLSATDNCDGILTVSPTADTTAGACINDFMIVRTWTFTDLCGNESSVSQTITVNDDTAPVAPSAPADVTEQCATDVPAEVDLTATDNCDGNITVSPTADTTAGACINDFMIVRTWTFTDLCGNESSVSQTITVNDDTAPVAPSAPLDVMEQCATDVPAEVDLSATDNCDGDITVSPTADTTAGACINDFMIVRTWTFTDLCGNESSVSQTITVSDDTAPIAPSAPLDVTEQCATDVPAEVDLTATDNCDGNITVSPTADTTAGACINDFMIVRTWTFTDACGNESSVSQTIIISDTTDPVTPSAPADVTEQCAIDVPAEVDLTATDNCDGNITVSPTADTTAGACINDFMIVRTWTFTDACGNSSNVSQTITVSDDTAPIAPSAPADVTEQCATDVPAEVDLTATDNCDGNIIVSPTADTTAGACINDFMIVRTWTFTDLCGNESSVSQTITVSDDTAPVAPIAPADVTEQCATDVPSEVDLTATDNCDGDITVSPTADTTAGACINDFMIVRTWTFTDLCGNESSVSQTITVNDDTAPVAPSAPADVTEQCATDVPAEVDLTATDNCDGMITVSPTSDTTAGACINDFMIVRKWTFTDLCGNESSVSQTITVSDDTAPIAPSAPLDVTEQCATDVPAEVDLTATDNCDGDITVSPTADTTAGACINDFMIVRTWTFTDLCGNESSVSQTIIVSDDTAPVAPSAPADVTEQCATDVPAEVDLTATDNCDGMITVSPTSDTSAGACINDFMIVRTWTFTDLCGNESSVSQTIKVSDDIAPVAPSAPADVTEQCATDVPAEVDLTATDNCDGDITVSPTSDTTTGACINDFMIVRTWTFTDACGNSSNVSQTIIISDDTAPVAPSAPADVTEQCATDVPAEVDLTATDNCDGDITVSPTSDTTAGACINDFMIVRTWTFTDLCGNESSVSQTITVNDDTAPVAPSAPVDVTELCATDVPAEVDLTATDNCDGMITVSPIADTTAGACISDFTIVRTWTFTDLCGNESSVIQTIKVSDDTAPVAPSAPADVTEQCATDVPAEVNLSATDNCDGILTVSPTADTTAGSCINDFMIVRTWTFTDLCGNESSVSQTITVNDDTAPIAPSAPADVTEQCATDVPAEVNLSATDNCDGILTVSPTADTTAGACINDFMIVRTWTFTDLCGNESSVSQTITVSDDIAPVAPSAPADVTEQCATDVPAEVNLSATDNCDGILTVSPTADTTAGACINDFMIVRTWTFTDLCGNESSVSQTIKVSDDIAPVAPSAPADVTEQCATDVPAEVNLSATDNCDGILTVSPTADTTAGACINDFMIVRTWTFTDLCGNESSVSQTITVSDDTAPVAPSAPADVTEQCATDVPAEVDLTATDNCDGMITVSPTSDTSAGACINDFMIVRTWTFTDACGNSSNVSQTIIISDDTAPVAPSAPADVTELCATDVPAEVDLTATDNCDGMITVSPIADTTAGACISDFTIVRTWTFTDLCGNESSVIQTIKVSDDTAPVAPSAPADVTEQCATDVPAEVDLTATDNCDGNITVSPTADTTAGACINDFMIVRTWTFTDLCGNESSVSQTIKVSDDIAPVAPSAPADVTEQCATDVPAEVNLSATDNCDGILTVSPTADTTAGACINDFMIVRTWTFTDLCGNESSVSQTITVSDDTAPIAPSAPADVTEQCATDVPAEVDLTATDNCDGNITVSPTADTTAGACINDFMIVRTWTFTDLCGNESSVSQTITVNDDTAPIAPSAPADVTEQCATDVPAEVDLTATDNCDGMITVSPIADTTAGACISDFTIVRTWTFTDLCGNESSVSQTITVSDDTAPVAPSAPADVTEQCATDVPAEVDLTATDNCDENITVSPTADTTAGACINDFMIVRTWTFTDLCGNESSVSQTITVNDDTAPVAPSAPADVMEQCATDVPSEVDLTATDNCDGDITVSPTADTTAGACINDFTIVRTWTFTDLCGNESSVSQTITVNDDTAPVAPSAPADVTEQCATAVPSEVDLTATDNCDGNITVSPTADTTAGACINDFMIVRTWTFTDLCGNESSVSQTITVNDDTAPVAPSVPADVTEQCATDVPSEVDLTATDNCDGMITVSPTSDTTAGACINDFMIVRTWTFTDLCGNESSVSQTITVNDDTAPVAPSAPLDVTEQCATDVPAEVDLTATDNCDGMITVSPTSDTTAGACINDFMIVRTWTFTDLCGNESSVSQTITVSDDIAPVAPSAPADVTEQCATDVPTEVDLTATDNCDGMITVSPTSDTTAGSCINDFMIVRTWTFTDLCSNESSVSQTITVSDDTAPVAPSAPADVTEQCATDVPSEVDLTATDNCDGILTVSPTADTTAGACINDFMIVRTWTFTDLCGNESSVSQTITVNDDTAPVAPIAPADVTEQCATDVPAEVDLTATDNCDGDITVSPTADTTAGACINDFTIVRTWTFTDLCGNESSVSQTITVSDDTAPIAPSAPLDVTEQCATDVPSEVDLTATDNCDGILTVSPTADTTAGSCINDFMIVRTWTFTDLCGNESSVSQTITVNDDTAPVAPSAPADVTEQCATDVPAEVDLTATDNCDGDITVSPTADTTAGACINDFTIVRTWTFTDLCGNESSVSQTITVNDDTGPVAPSAPADVTEQCAADVPAEVDLTATDNCDGNITVSPTADTTAGSCINDFTIVRTWTFTDACGNSSNVSQTIIISDDTAPVAPSAPLDVTELCATDVPAEVDLTATDNCDGMITVSPIADTTAGACISDFTIVRTWTFTDLCGNESSVSQTITVNDDTAPVAPSAPADVTEQCATDVPAKVDLTATDNCDGDITVSPTSDTTAGACINDFTIVRTWSFTDACGNSSNVSQTIIISDTIAPVLSEQPQDTIVYCEPDIPGDQGVGAIDNCEGSIPIFFTTSTDDSFPDSIIIENTWTASDCNGNEVSHTQIVTFIPKLPQLELTKSSTLNNSGANGLTQIGDTIFYEFLIKNTGNTPLNNLTLVDPILTFVDCDSTSLQGGSQSMCRGYYIINGNDINNGLVQNSAIIIAEVIDGSQVRDTSDSGNLNDEKGTDSDQTFTYLNQEGNLSLLKTVGETNDTNGNGVLDIGDQIIYKFKVINTGNVTIYNLNIEDPIVDVMGGLDSLESGEIDSLSFTAIYNIDEIDAQNGYVENTAIISGGLPISMGGDKIQDISDAGDDFKETFDANGMIDGDSSNDPVFICVVGPFNCPDNLEISACLSREEIEKEFQNWVSGFQGGGCGAEIRFLSQPVLPEICGGSTHVEMRLIDVNGDTISNYNCSSLFTIVEETQAPICPNNWDLTIIPSNDECTVLPYANGMDLFNKTGIELIDNCTSFDLIELSYTDSLVPYNCNGSETFFPNSREVIRSYALTDACGNSSEMCPQKLTFEIDACKSLNTFGKIAINGLTEIEVQSTCDIPLIEVIEEEDGVCGYVEYMWLYTTQEDADGNPEAPTSLNIGSVWIMLPGETKSTLDLGILSQNTHYVRCARNFSCCDFGESNWISIRIVNTNVPCPASGGFFTNKDCQEEIELTSPENDYSSGQNVEHITNLDILAKNKVRDESRMLLNAAQSTLLLQGFEVSNKAVLEVNTTGCKED